jgi:hypothetical protein
MFGRLAQLVEHVFDVDRVTGSSPVPPTNMSSWVNKKIKIGNAGKKGRGLFSNAPITAGEIIIVQSGQIVSDRRITELIFKPFYSICVQVEEDAHICPEELDTEKMDGIFLINHSCSPNCGFRGQITLVAMRDIQVGEEITYDYVMTDANEGLPCENIECLCGSDNCRHIITGNDWRRKDLQERYKGYFSTFIERLINNEI